MTSIGQPPQYLHDLYAGLFTYVKIMGVEQNDISSDFVMGLEMMLNESLPRTEIDKVQIAILRTLVSIRKNIFCNMIGQSKCAPWLLWISIGTVINNLGLLGKIEVHVKDGKYVVNRTKEKMNIDESRLRKELANMCISPIPTKAKFETNANPNPKFESKPKAKTKVKPTSDFEPIIYGTLAQTFVTVKQKVRPESDSGSDSNSDSNSNVDSEPALKSDLTAYLNEEPDSDDDPIVSPSVAKYSS